ncbi:MAG: hypothetical protein IPH93_05350 [Saprospiraceae bacterium]|nr:hypothetical protein [Saprospiraceae bacterium]
MIYYHYDSPTWSDCGGIDGDCRESFANLLSSIHDEFYEEFSDLGTLNIPHYGISNGSLLGKEQSFSIGSKLSETEISIDDLLQQSGFNGFWSGFTQAAVGIFIGSGFFSKHIIHALAEKGRHRVYYGGYGTVVLLIPIVKDFERPVKDSRPYDRAPGGMRIFEKGLNWNFESFCFIPTISALKLNTEDPYYTNISNLEDIEKTKIKGLTQLNHYSGSLEEKLFYDKGNKFWNEDHVTLNKRLANYLKTLVGYLNYIVTSPLENATFNFGSNNPTISDLNNSIKVKIRKLINYDLDILEGGNLWINKQNKIGYIHDKNNPMNGYSQLYELEKSRLCRYNFIDN